MNPVLPISLLCTALALVIAHGERRTIWVSLVVATLVFVGTSSFTPLKGGDQYAFLGLWLSVILTAASVYLGPKRRDIWAIVCSANAGLWAGLVAAYSGGPSTVLMALPALILGIPARLLLKSGLKLPVLIITSWIIAIGILVSALSLTPTPGYRSDHIE